MAEFYLKLTKGTFGVWIVYEGFMHCVTLSLNWSMTTYGHLAFLACVNILDE